MRVLVTGAGGYIGCVLVPKLLNAGYGVHAIDRYFFGAEKIAAHPNLRIIREDARCLNQSHFHNIDAVIDLVAISNDPAGEVFDKATWEINHVARANAAKLAKAAGVSRYILPSSCSIYGFQDNKVSETAKTNPLTTYAKANEKAEQDVLRLADNQFMVTVMRQSTVFGYSPRMRFDLAINAMTQSAWKNGILPLMRDGKQYRPMVHIDDTTDVMLMLLIASTEKINGEIFNVGGDAMNYQVGPLAEMIAKVVREKTKKDVEIQWYGDIDHRSYYVSFDKIKNKLKWEPQWTAQKGVEQILEKLMSGELDRTETTITLDWYKDLEKWYPIIKKLELHNGMINI
ncbi:MAG: hypothetical protein ACD_42C00303G0001 [uncultured bacterium]|nr:MAG: hypothetical protein ACD_42C00303G0001 [uncultured bacterium]OGT34324.1 MAG: NAD-dependent dehydratase [Gammaproteobacteria bacterium RIFCSPHIGHO2_02_FULL_39_13]OGT48974.1 MAG: NAD-dependent dehydratase [Gammaproteobacteria bacterium RIFCSPHIGHO2_12_FULL_39_24]